MTDDLAARVLAAIEETEQIAREAIGPGGNPRIGTAGQWNAYLEGGDDGWAIESDDAAGASCIVGAETMASHIAHHDPAATLRRCEADRKIVERYQVAARLLNRLNERAKAGIVRLTERERQERATEGIRANEARAVLVLLAKGYGITTEATS